jgi:hypothetical protein
LDGNDKVKVNNSTFLLAKILTVGLGHELCDRAWQLGLLTVYGITALAVALHIYHKNSS